MKAWWKAVWEKRPSQTILVDALRGASKAASTAGHLLHDCANGGASAYLSALQRVGWKACDFQTIELASGRRLELGRNCDPKMLLRLASQAIEESIAVQSELANTLSSIEMPDGYHRASSSASEHVPIGTLTGMKEAAPAAWWDQFQHREGKLVPWLKPAKDAHRQAQKTCAPSAAASLASYVEGGWWPQARLHHCKLAADP